MNAYAVSLSKYVNTGILALFTLLSYLGLMTRPGRMRRAIEIIQRILLAGFLINANMTIAWLAEGSASRMLLILCAMEILFMLSFMVLYRIVHEMANMMLFNNICMLLSIGFVTISRIAFYGNMEDIEYGSGEPIKQFVMASAGLLIMLVIPFFRRFFDSLRHMWIVFAVLGIAPLAAVLLLSRETNGAQITSTILGFTFQPSEFVKILFILMLAGILSGDVTKEKAVLATILSLIHVGILVRSTDLGSALIFFIVYLMVLFIATGKWSVIFGGFGLGAVGSVICYFLFYHVKVRVGIWRDPFSVIDGMGYQITQSLFAISYGGLCSVSAPSVHQLLYPDPDPLRILLQPLFPALYLRGCGLLYFPDLFDGRRRDQVYPADRCHTPARQLRRKFGPVHPDHVRNDRDDLHSSR